ncbi:hypothetical protein CGRA01v4_04353 [Colletotrichum graminicola]|nr:hypothetical protein CGRA01v4_04353 [Colletotrichum graminicola]
MCDYDPGAELLGNRSLEAGTLAQGLVRVGGGGGEVVITAEPVQERRRRGRLSVVHEELPAREPL